MALDSILKTTIIIILVLDCVLGGITDGLGDGDTTTGTSTVISVCIGDYSV